jgi:zinc metalloprotease ZmpB
MTQTFDAASKSMLTRDAQGVVRDVLHVEQPFQSHAGTSLLAAREYLLKYGALLGIAPAELGNFSLAPEKTPQPLGVEYRFSQEKPQFDMTTVVFEQTMFGLPIWQAAVSVHMQQKPFVVVSVQSSRHVTVDAQMPSDKAMQRAAKLDPATLAKQLGADTDKRCEAASLTVLRQRLVVYRYDAAQRLAPDDHSMARAASAGNAAPLLHPVLPLPPLGEQIGQGAHRVAVEATFTLTWNGIKDLPWVALVDVETLAVLYLRAFIDGVNGLVFMEDPITANGGPLPGATAAELNALRTTVQLADINPPVAGTVALTGSQVTVTNVEVPNTLPPTRPAGSPFDYAARTDDFSAVNAYYHCNRFFDLVQDLGFHLPTYFTGTLFPSVVDHRGHYGSATGIEINAYCMGNGTHGIARTAFMLADLGDTVNPMGLACDWRVVLHELGGHGILYNHVNSANFGFAHSAGDSFAAVLNDPQTRAPDRFQTFPWVYGIIDRRHDRDVTGGWAWGGTFDFGGYSSEQILCSTHFRLYRSVGGDSPELAMRTYASRYVAYLMLRTIGSLTQATNPGNPGAYASTMIAAERGNWVSEDMVGGVYGKVVRWAFEKQGLYQPPGAPTPVKTEGAPPAVDLYIDDGRHGEYGFLEKFWETQDIWNRIEPDGEKAHQTPLVCCTNHAYVRVKNRGTETAKGARVHAYHCRPSAGLVWPDDFEPMTTASLAVPSLAPGASAVVGPFQWTPVHAGHECMFMSVTLGADRANNDPLTGLASAKGPTPAWRLVPSDNNIAMRALIPVPGGAGRCALEAAFCNRKFWAHNPFAKTARMEVRAVLPPVLASRGWAMHFNNPGGGAFSLGPRDAREIRPVLLSGRDFSVAELVDAGPATIVVLVLADGLVVGGLSFAIDPAMTQPAKEYGPCWCKQPEPTEDGCGDKPACKPTKRCCCEPCIDDRCCPPPQPCCGKCHDKPCEDDDSHKKDDDCEDDRP